MTLQEDICSLLKANSLVTDYGVDCFGNYMPEEPSNLVVIHEYPGDPYDPLAGFANRSIQISVRDLSASTAESKCLSIFKLFIAENKQIKISDTRTAQVHLRQTPFKLYQDTLDRTVFCFNIGITTTLE